MYESCEHELENVYDSLQFVGASNPSILGNDMVLCSTATPVASAAKYAFGKL